MEAIILRILVHRYSESVVLIIGLSAVSGAVCCEYSCLLHDVCGFFVHYFTDFLYFSFLFLFLVHVCFACVFVPQYSSLAWQGSVRLLTSVVH